MENSNNLNKIGIAKDPTKRKRQLELASGCQIRIMKCWQTVDASALEVERYLHTRFARKRLQGEWFDNITISDIEYAGYELLECNKDGTPRRII